MLQLQHTLSLHSEATILLHLISSIPGSGNSLYIDVTQNIRKDQTALHSTHLPTSIYAICWLIY
jgi:hypothetical protein